MDFDDLVALLCEDFSVLPSIILLEECPRLFKVWKKLKKNKSDQTREDRLWNIIIAPLYHSAMTDKGAKSQTDYSRQLTRALQDPEEVRAEDEYNSRIVEENLKKIGINVIKR